MLSSSDELQKPETTVDDVMVAKMAWFEFAAPSARIPGTTRFLADLPGRGTANRLTRPSAANAMRSWRHPQPSTELEDREEQNLPRPRRSGQAESDRTDRKRFTEDALPAVRSQTELVFAEVTWPPTPNPAAGKSAWSPN